MVFVEPIGFRASFRAPWAPGTLWSCQPAGQQRGGSKGCSALFFFWRETLGKTLETLGKTDVVLPISRFCQAFRRFF